MLTKEEWLDGRCNGIGASESAAILGYDPFQSPWSVWQRKVDRPAEQDYGPMAEWGHRHEAAIAAKFAEVRESEQIMPGAELYDPGDYAMIWSTDGSPMFATLDRALRRNGVIVAPVEIKCAWFDRAREFQEQLPIHYRIQVTHQMICTDTTEAYYCVLLNGYDFRWYRETLNEKFAASLIKRVNEFWQLVKDRTAPPTDWRDGTRHAITDHYGYQPDEIVQLTPEFSQLDLDRHNLNERKNELDRKLKSIDNRIRESIGSASVGVLPDGESAWSWKKNKAGTRTLKRIKWKGTDD